MANSYRSLGWAMLSGFIATFVATRWGYLETQVGLPPLDFLTFAGSQVAPKDASAAFVYNWGALLHYVDGALFGVIYDRYIYARLPGHNLFRGLIYGILVWIGAGLVYLPLSGGGLFGATMGGPFLWAVLIWHIVWGIVLGVFYPGMLMKRSER